MALRFGTDWAGTAQSLSAAGAIVAAIAHGALAIGAQIIGEDAACAPLLLILGRRRRRRSRADIAPRVGFLDCVRAPIHRRLVSAIEVSVVFLFLARAGGIAVSRQPPGIWLRRGGPGHQDYDQYRADGFAQHGRPIWLSGCSIIE